MAFGNDFLQEFFFLLILKYSNKLIFRSAELEIENEKLRKDLMLLRQTVIDRNFTGVEKKEILGINLFNFFLLYTECHIAQRKFEIGWGLLIVTILKKLEKNYFMFRNYKLLSAT